MKSATETLSQSFQETLNTFQKWKLTQNLKTFYLCTISALIVYPALLIIITPILIYRQIIQLLVLNTDPKYKKILTGWDATLAFKDPYKPVASICPYFAFNNKIDINHIKRTFNEKVIKTNLYPNLCQRIIRKFGYYFWYEIEDFSLDNHIRYLHPNSPNTPVKITEIRDLCVKISADNYEPSRSPWEIILVPNLYDDQNPSIKSCLIVRTQHCLMDGFSVANLLKTVSESSWELSGTSSSQSAIGSQRVGMFQKSFKMLQLLFTGPYHALRMQFCTNDNTPFVKDILDTTPDKRAVVLEREPPRHDGAKLKKIRDGHKVGMTSLLITIAVEGVSRFVKRRYEVSKLPNQIYVHMSFPLPNHPDELTNHWTFVRLPVQFRPENDALKTLNDVHSQYELMKTSVLPTIALMFGKILGILPIIFHPKPFDMMNQTIILVNFPGPKQKSDLFGYPFEYCSVLSNNVKGSAFFAGTENYNGEFWVDLAGLNKFLKDQRDVNEMQEYVHATIKELEQPEGHEKENQN